MPIATVLAKYDGLTTQEANGVLRRYKITRLPPFLILHMKRFTKNNFVEEKNPTIVNFPLRGVDMKDCTLSLLLSLLFILSICLCSFSDYSLTLALRSSTQMSTPSPRSQTTTTS